MVGGVEALVAGRTGGPAGRGGHHAERGAERCEPLLLGTVVERMPFEVVGIPTVGVALGERRVERGHVGVPRGQQLGTLIGGRPDERDHRENLPGPPWRARATRSGRGAGTLDDLRGVFYGARADVRPARHCFRGVERPIPERRRPASVLDGEKILITGATGKIAFPIARSLAKRNEVWGAARLSNPGNDNARRRRRATPAARHVEWRLLGGARRLYLCLPCRGRPRRGRLAPLRADQRRPLRQTHAPLPHGQRIRVLLDRLDLQVPGASAAEEADGPGVPDRANYSFSKIAGEAVCTWVAEHFRVPLTIIRICSTYGPQGGAPADRLELILQGKPIASTLTSPTTSTRSTRTTTSISVSAPWRWPRSRRSSSTGRAARP